jgi:hypothetical protein
MTPFPCLLSLSQTHNMMKELPLSVSLERSAARQPSRVGWATGRPLNKNTLNLQHVKRNSPAPSPAGCCRGEETLATARPSLPPPPPPPSAQAIRQSPRGPGGGLASTRTLDKEARGSLLGRRRCPQVDGVLVVAALCRGTTRVAM